MHHRADDWPCERLAPCGESVASHRDTYFRIEVVRLEGALVRLRLGEGRLRVFAAAASRDCTDRAVAESRRLMPPPPPAPEKKEATITFWASGLSGNCHSRRLAMTSWGDITANYMPATREALSELMELDLGGAQGNLILWQGKPGTGKTYALRALAWEWREHCDVEYVVDPETFLGHDSRYLLNVLLSKGVEGGDEIEGVVDDGSSREPNRVSVAPAGTRGLGGTDPSGCEDRNRSGPFAAAERG